MGLAGVGGNFAGGYPLEYPNGLFAVYPLYILAKKYSWFLLFKKKHRRSAKKQQDFSRAGAFDSPCRLHRYR